MQAYYFLKHYSPETLTSLQNTDVSSKEYRLQLYNAMAEIFMAKSKELNTAF